MCERERERERERACVYLSICLPTYMSTYIHIYTRRYYTEKLAYVGASFYVNSYRVDSDKLPFCGYGMSVLVGLFCSLIGLFIGLF